MKIINITVISLFKSPKYLELWWYEWSCTLQQDALFNLSSEATLSKCKEHKFSYHNLIKGNQNTKALVSKVAIKFTNHHCLTPYRILCIKKAVMKPNNHLCSLNFTFMKGTNTRLFVASVPVKLQFWMELDSEFNTLLVLIYMISSI